MYLQIERSKEMFYRLEVRIDENWGYDYVVEGESEQEAIDLFTMEVAAIILISSRGEEFLLKFSESYRIAGLVDNFFQDETELVGYFNKWRYGDDVRMDDPQTIRLIDYILKQDYDVDPGSLEIM